MSNHRVRSLITPRRDPTMDQIANVVDTMEGKNNPAPRDLPPVDVDQAMKALMADAAKEPCYLDAQEPAGVHIFRVPEGLNLCGQQFVFYTLCELCRLDITSKGRAEYQLVRKLQEENGQVPIELVN